MIKLDVRYADYFRAVGVLQGDSRNAHLRRRQATAPPTAPMRTPSANVEGAGAQVENITSSIARA
jgi:hypothetical protein